MKEQKFQMIFDKFQQTEKIVKNFISKYDVYKIIHYNDTEFNNFLERSKKIHSLMDTVNVDLYHIIGMCNLSASQMSKIIKQIKKIEQMRHPIKQIIGYQSQLIAARNIFKKLASISSKSKGEYTFKNLDNKNLFKL